MPAESVEHPPSEPDFRRRSKWHATAAKIEADPSLLEIPLANIDRWLARSGDGRERLEHWRTLIKEARNSPAAMRRLLDLLRADDENSRQMKSYSPFPGILSPEEVDRFECAWRH